jgi:hypothetical protein
MAEDVVEEIENALNLVVNTTEQSSNMRKTLKEKIYQTVSTLRQLIAKITISGEQKSSEINNLTKKISTLETELVSYKEKQNKRHQTPSFDSKDEQEETGGGTNCMTSTGATPAIAEQAQRAALPTRQMTRQYAAVVRETKPKRYKMIVRSKKAHQPEEIQQLLKAKINPGEIKVGVTTLKLLNDSVLVETNSTEETEALGREIEAKCGEDLEPHIHRLRKPRIIIINVPEDIDTTNIEDAIITQNPELNLTKGSISAKFTQVTKRKYRNAIVEVGADTRRTILHRKIKIGWQICKTDDYVTATRCFKCSKFNHRTTDCRGEVTCPLCAGPHTIKECKSNPTEHKCVNCVAYNRHNPTKAISEAHTALDKRCPSLQAVLERNRQNTEY